MMPTSLRILGIAIHPLSLVGYHQALLQIRVVGGDAGRAGVAIALQRLNTAERKHEATGTHHHIGAHAQRPGHLPGVTSLPLADESDACFRSIAAQDVGNQRQALTHG